MTLNIPRDAGTTSAAHDVWGEWRNIPAWVRILLPSVALDRLLREVRHNGIRAPWSSLFPAESPLYAALVDPRGAAGRIKRRCNATLLAF